MRTTRKRWTLQPKWFRWRQNRTTFTNVLSRQDILDLDVTLVAKEKERCQLMSARHESMLSSARPLVENVDRWDIGPQTSFALRTGTERTLRRAQLHLPRRLRTTPERAKEEANRSSNEWCTFLWMNMTEVWSQMVQVPSWWPIVKCRLLRVWRLGKLWHPQKRHHQMRSWMPVSPKHRRMCWQVDPWLCLQVRQQLRLEEFWFLCRRWMTKISTWWKKTLENTAMLWWILERYVMEEPYNLEILEPYTLVIVELYLLWRSFRHFLCVSMFLDMRHMESQMQNENLRLSVEVWNQLRRENVCIQELQRLAPMRIRHEWLVVIVARYCNVPRRHLPKRCRSVTKKSANIRTKTSEELQLLLGSGLAVIAERLNVDTRSLEKLDVLELRIFRVRVRQDLAILVQTEEMPQGRKIWWTCSVRLCPCNRALEWNWPVKGWTSSTASVGRWSLDQDFVHELWAQGIRRGWQFLWHPHRQHQCQLQDLSDLRNQKVKPLQHRLHRQHRQVQPGVMPEVTSDLWEKCIQEIWIFGTDRNWQEESMKVRLFFTCWTMRRATVGSLQASIEPEIFGTNLSLSLPSTWWFLKEPIWRSVVTTSQRTRWSQSLTQDATTHVMEKLGWSSTWRQRKWMCLWNHVRDVSTVSVERSRWLESARSLWRSFWRMERKPKEWLLRQSSREVRHHCCCPHELRALWVWWWIWGTVRSTVTSSSRIWKWWIETDFLDFVYFLEKMYKHLILLFTLRRTSRWERMILRSERTRRTRSWSRKKTSRITWTWEPPSSSPWVEVGRRSWKRTWIPCRRKIRQCGQPCEDPWSTSRSRESYYLEDAEWHWWNCLQGLRHWLWWSHPWDFQWQSPSTSWTIPLSIWSWRRTGTWSTSVLRRRIPSCSLLHQSVGLGVPGNRSIWPRTSPRQRWSKRRVESGTQWSSGYVRWSNDAWEKGVKCNLKTLGLPRFGLCAVCFSCWTSNWSMPWQEKLSLTNGLINVCMDYRMPLQAIHIRSVPAFFCRQNSWRFGWEWSVMEDMNMNRSKEVDAPSCLNDGHRNYVKQWPTDFMMRLSMVRCNWLFLQNFIRKHWTKQVWWMASTERRTLDQWWRDDVWMDQRSNLELRIWKKVLLNLSRRWSWNKSESEEQNGFNFLGQNVWLYAVSIPWRDIAVNRHWSGCSAQQEWRKRLSTLRDIFNAKHARKWKRRKSHLQCDPWSHLFNSTSTLRSAPMSSRFMTLLEIVTLKHRRYSNQVLCCNASWWRRSP